jgi:excinuclease UvrABC nuclease subunit
MYDKIKKGYLIMLNLADEHTEQLKYMPGIYCLFNGQQLQYIGQSSNIYKRIQNHLEENKRVTRILVIKIGFSSMLDDIDAFTITDLESNIELREILKIGLIHSLQPRLNKLLLPQGTFSDWLALLPSTTFYKKTGANQEQMVVRIARLQKMIHDFQNHSSSVLQIYKGIVLKPIDKK